MSLIAILDTYVNPRCIGNKPVSHINLCNSETNNFCDEISHGSLCAMVLNKCADNYELLNIQIFSDITDARSTEIELLVNALALCEELCVDIVSLSAVSSILTDSMQLYNVTRELSKSAVIVSALSNSRYVTVPTSYPHVLGVSHDLSSTLQPGEVATVTENALGVDLYANCDFEFLRELGYAQSNSFAVPVAVAHINGLLNRGYTTSDVMPLIRQKQGGILHEYLHFPVRFSTEEIPVVFIADDTTDFCRSLMDDFYNKHETQSAALSFVKTTYDVRVMSANGNESIQENVRFMERHYKTDIIFIVGNSSILTSVQNDVDIDIVVCRSTNNLFRLEYEDVVEIIGSDTISERLHEILTI